ncbi:GFP-like non-fluorescent chromoprotein [Porites lutea]|uniref:GFP-like non-fluorescent chromoprotein n=1 Tax=Porites lutea TaxID=51062 RepID=UPI003CC508C3
MKLKVTKGAPLPFSIDILLPQEMYGSKPFIKYPKDIPDYIKLSFPEGITWERTMTFEDGAVCTASNDSRLVGNCFIYEVKFQGVNFPRDGPVMQKKTDGWEPSTERLYEWDGCQRGDVDMALKLKGGGHYTVNFKTTYKSKKPGLKVPPYHFVDHKLVLLSHKIDGVSEEFEQEETAQAHLSNIA